MKKQILILVVFLMAAFASVTNSYGQCTDDALHPMAGKLYHYVISAAGGGGTPTYQWIVTTTPNIVAASTYATTIAPGANTYTMANGDAADCSITWSPTVIAAAIAGTPYYVSVRYTATNSEGCVVDNVKSYQIDPVNMFQIDLANVKADASALASGNVCTSPIVAATINPGATPTITYDYGTSTMYVKVTATNFSGSWDMTVENTLLTNLSAGETSALSWSRTIGGAATPVTPGTPITIPEVDADPTNAEDIFLTFVVDHNTWEGLNTEAFGFTVNGKDQTGLDDVSATCTAEADVVTQTIIERPTITDGTDVGTYIMP